MTTVDLDVHDRPQRTMWKISNICVTVISRC